MSSASSDHISILPWIVCPCCCLLNKMFQWALPAPKWNLRMHFFATRTAWFAVITVHFENIRSTNQYTKSVVHFSIQESFLNWSEEENLNLVTSWGSQKTTAQHLQGTGPCTAGVVIHSNRTGTHDWQLSSQKVNIYIPHEHTKERRGTWEISPWLPLGRHHQKVKSLQHLQQNCFQSWDSRSLTDAPRSFAWEWDMSERHNGCWKNMLWGVYCLKCQKRKKAFGQLLLSFLLK